MIRCTPYMTKKNTKETEGNPYDLQNITRLILKIFQDIPRPLNYKQVAKQLGHHGLEPGRDVVIQCLLKLEASEEIMLIDHFKYRLRPKRTYLEGYIELTQKGSGYVTVEGLEKDIFISPIKTANALNGDKVKIMLYDSGRDRQDAEVVDVLERVKTDYAGIIEITPRFAFLKPDNNKMPVDIFIPLNHLNNAQQGEKVVAQIIEWKKGEKNPTGKIIHVLGMPGENDTEMHAILSEYGLPLSFPKLVEAEADTIPETIPEEEIARRRDFRGTTTFTIDPEDAKDFDDALSIKKLKNGLYEIGVHIADVTHYLPEGSVMDKEAFERATSIYLVDRVIPMLPEKLSNHVCSLRPNEDKLCFSAVFHMNEDGKISDEWFGRTVIHSIKRFTYEEAQSVIETQEGPLKEEILLMDSIAKTLRAERFKKGAISFEKTEVKFRLDERGNPLSVYTKENKDSNKLIEEFMLLANRKVAEFASKKAGIKRTFVYRVHDVPVADKLLAFTEFAGKFGYRVNTGNEKEIASSLNKLMKDVRGKKEQNVLEQLAIRTMAKAIYTTDNIGHYGLAFEYYSHFTSPIRRYPDVMVHRILQHYLDGKGSVNAKNFELKCKHATDMEIKASHAERDSIKFKQVQFLQSRVGQIFDGIVSGVTEWGMFVEISENKCEGMIRLRDMRDDYYLFDERNFCISGKRKRKKFQLGDSVKVKIIRADLLKRQVDMELV